VIWNLVEDYLGKDLDDREKVVAVRIIADLLKAASTPVSTSDFDFDQLQNTITQNIIAENNIRSQSNPSTALSAREEDYSFNGDILIQPSTRYTTTVTTLEARVGDGPWVQQKYWSQQPNILRGIHAERTGQLGSSTWYEDNTWGVVSYVEFTPARVIVPLYLYLLADPAAFTTVASKEELRVSEWPGAIYGGKYGNEAANLDPLDFSVKPSFVSSMAEAKRQVRYIDPYKRGSFVETINTWNSALSTILMVAASLLKGVPVVGEAISGIVQTGLDLIVDFSEVDVSGLFERLPKSLWYGAELGGPVVTQNAASLIYTDSVAINSNTERVVKVTTPLTHSADKRYFKHSEAFSEPIATQFQNVTFRFRHDVEEGTVNWLESYSCNSVVGNPTSLPYQISINVPDAATAVNENGFRVGAGTWDSVVVGEYFVSTKDGVGGWVDQIDQLQ
jgi:hypothetical protein